MMAHLKQSGNEESNGKKDGVNVAHKSTSTAKDTSKTDDNTGHCSHVGRYRYCSVADHVSTSGVAIIVNKKQSIFRRLLWLLVLLVFIGSLIYQLDTHLKLLLKSRVDRHFSYRVLHTIPLPSITLCHVNKYRPTLALKMARNNTTYDQWLDNEEFSLLDWEHHSLSELLETASYHWQDMVAECLAGMRWCSNSTPFNSRAASLERLNSRLTENYTSLLGLCSTFSSNETVAEPMLGMGQLHLSMKERDPLLAAAADTDGEPAYHGGWLALLHPHTYDSIELATIAGLAHPVHIPINTHVAVQVDTQQQQLIAQEENDLNSGDPAGRQQLSCQNDGEQATIDCLKRCLVEKRRKMFGKGQISVNRKSCKILWQPETLQQPECRNFEQYLRSSYRKGDNYTSRFNLHMSYGNTVNVAVLQQLQDCRCASPCHSTVYTTHVPQHRPLRTKRSGQSAESRVRARLTVIMNPTEQCVTDRPAYTFNQFLSDVGGSLGLMIGGSLLTIVEVIDLIACRVSARMHNQKQTQPLTKQPTTQQQQQQQQHIPETKTIMS